MNRVIQFFIFLSCSVAITAQKNLVIAGLQMNVSRSIAENERTIIQHLQSLKDKQVDFLITPNPHLPWKMKEAGAEVIFHIINSGTDMGYRTFHESSVELWARTLEIPIVEVNAAHGDYEINAGSGVISEDEVRTKSVKNKGEQLFIHNLSLK